MPLNVTLFENWYTVLTNETHSLIFVLHKKGLLSALFFEDTALMIYFLFFVGFNNDMVAIDYTYKGTFKKNNMGIILKLWIHENTHCTALKNLVTTHNALMALIHLPQLYCP
jgi:hypothetical protein